MIGGGGGGRCGRCAFFCTAAVWRRFLPLPTASERGGCADAAPASPSPAPPNSCFRGTAGRGCFGEAPETTIVGWSQPNTGLPWASTGHATTGGGGGCGGGGCGEGGRRGACPLRASPAKPPTVPPAAAAEGEKLPSSRSSTPGRCSHVHGRSHDLSLPLPPSQPWFCPRDALWWPSAPHGCLPCSVMSTAGGGGWTAAPPEEEWVYTTAPRGAWPRPSSASAVRRRRRMDRAA